MCVCVCVCVSTDPAMSFKGLTRALVPVLDVDQQPDPSSTTTSSTLPPFTLKDLDLETETTVL